MRAPSPSAKRRSARRPKPEERPQYAQRPIASTVEITFPTPPSTNSLFANVAGRGRIKTPAYRGWRNNAMLVAGLQRPSRIAGPCDVTIHMPPFAGDIDNRIKPCLDLARELGVIADDGPRYVRSVNAQRAAAATDIRMVFVAIPVEAEDQAEILVRAREGQSVAYIAVALGLTEGQVLTVLAEARS
ncbi:hypothetical protein MMB17_07325 [Methylobacterium organophilum]|uniref:hypothetical protein n=1 Tax=Methylobacterium organophilum TaxID=410 RepID=UPI001F13DBE3|nr:hypothetical protein [Methylobacterium organophilum]UMY19100.1 hypothetical protein MMB17_07325 [Methylobacterium organophilum]